MNLASSSSSAYVVAVASPSDRLARVSSAPLPKTNLQIHRFARHPRTKTSRTSPASIAGPPRIASPRPPSAERRFSRFSLARAARARGSRRQSPSLSRVAPRRTSDRASRRQRDHRTFSTRSPAHRAARSPRHRAGVPACAVSRLPSSRARRARGSTSVSSSRPFASARHSVGRPRADRAHDGARRAEAVTRACFAPPTPRRAARGARADRRAAKL